jgi:hypothetical protein
VKTTMSYDDDDDDDAEIKHLIASQFSSLCWSQAKGPNDAQFLAGFVPGAIMVAARRPVKTSTPDEFVARMERLSKTKLTDFKEAAHGIFVKRVGSVAVAFAGCEMEENNAIVTRDVSALLLVKDHQGWRIAAQAWDLVDAFPQL